MNSQFLSGGGGLCGNVDVVGSAYTVNTCGINQCIHPQVTNVTIVDASCGESNGSITIDLADPLGCAYLWSSIGATGRTVTGLTPGVYSVTVSLLSDPTCFEVFGYAVGSANGTQISVDAKTDASCGSNDGTVSLSPSSGWLTWKWSDGLQLGIEQH